MTLRERLFGPSKFQQMLNLMREDRAAQAAVFEKFVEVNQRQIDLLNKQWETWTAPTKPNVVGMRLPEDEVRFERMRSGPNTTAAPDSLLADLKAEFAAHAQH